MPHKHSTRLLLLIALALPLAACDQLGIETPAQVSARQEAEGRALGSACRQAGRALEDCYAATPKVSKAAIFNGWRDMDAYMRENKLDIVVPEGEEPKPKKKKKAEEDEEEAPAKPEKAAEAPPEKPAEKTTEKAAAPAPPDKPKGGKSRQS